MLAGAIVASFNILLGIVVLLIPIAIIAISYQRFIVISYLYVAIFGAYIARFPGMGWFQYVDEVFTLGMIVIVFLYVVLNRTRIDKNLKHLFFGMTLFVIITTIVNRPSPLRAFLFILSYFRGFLLFYAIILWRKPGDNLRIIKLFWFVMIVQLIVNIAWLIGINPIAPTRLIFDRFKGTFTNMTALGYWCIFMIILSSAFFVSYRGRIRALSGVALMLALVLFFGTFTKHGVVFIAAGMGIWMLFFSRFSFFTKSMFFIGAIGLASITLSVMFKGEGADSGVKSAVMEQINRFPTTMKYRSYRSALVDAPKEYPISWLGAGPGNGMDVFAIQFNSKYAEKYINYIYLTYSGRRERFSEQGGSQLEMPGSGFISIYSDFGIGTILYYGIFFYVFYRIWKSIYIGIYKNKLDYIIASSSVCCGIVLLLYNFVGWFFAIHPLVGSFWLLAGIIWPDNAYTQPYFKEDNEEEIG